MRRELSNAVAYSTVPTSQMGSICQQELLFRMVVSVVEIQSSDYKRDHAMGHLPRPPPAAVARKQPAPLMLPQVALPSGWFICLWAAVVATHALCAVFLILFSRIYWFFQNPT